MRIRLTGIESRLSGSRRVRTTGSFVRLIFDFEVLEDLTQLQLDGGSRDCRPAQQCFASRFVPCQWSAKRIRLGAGEGCDKDSPVSTGGNVPDPEGSVRSDAGL